MRDETGTWPTVEMLDSEGIPPFTRDPLSSSTWLWTRELVGGRCAYVGVPAGRGRALVFFLVEPAPGAPLDTTTVMDDEHRRLRTGALVHTTLWWVDKSRVPASVVAPAAQGLVQVKMTTSPSMGAKP